MNTKHAMSIGEYLGFCELKGYIYSVPGAYSASGRLTYSIIAITKGKASTLITFESNIKLERKAAL